MAFVEVKRAAQDLNQRHLRQVETYSVKEGVEWMILTNGRVWEVYHVDSPPGAPIVTQPVFSNVSPAWRQARSSVPTEVEAPQTLRQG